MRALKDSVPDDDEDTVLAPHAEDAAIAVLVAAESAVTDAPAAVRAAVHLCEAADDAADLRCPSLEPDRPGYESLIAATPFVQQALSSVQSDLALAGTAEDAHAHRHAVLRQSGIWAITWPREIEQEQTSHEQVFETLVPSRPAQLQAAQRAMRSVIAGSSMTSSSMRGAMLRPVG